jgi:hypothetical protein
MRDSQARGPQARSDHMTELSIRGPEAGAA